MAAPTRSRRALLLTVSALAMPAVACARAAQPGPPAPGASTPAAASAGASPAAARAPATLEFWLPGRQADADALEPFHRQFLAETPAAAAVQIQLVPNETMMEQLTGALAAGTPPDAARLKEYRLADLGARDALLPLDSLVTKDAAVRLADFTPQSIEGSRFSGPAGQRVLLGLPDSHQMVVLYWNRDLVAGAGLDPQQPPASWAALRRAAQAVGDGAAGADTDAGASARRWGFQFYDFSPREQTYCWFMEWVWRAGGEVWSRDPLNGPPGAHDLPRVTLDTPAALRALQLHVDMLHADRTAVPPGTPVTDLIANVAQGRVGYWMTTANAALGYDRTAPGLRIGVGAMPPDARDAHQLQHNALSVFKASRAPDVAYRLLSFRSREDVQARWSAEGAWLPVRPALWQRPPFTQDERWRTIGALVHRPGNRTKPVVPEWDAFAAAVLPPIIAAWEGRLAPHQALQEAERAGNVHLSSRPATPSAPAR